MIHDFRFVWESKVFEFGISIGLVEINDHNNDTNTVMSRADMACNMAKQMGRNRVHAYEEGDLELARYHNEMEWVARLARAIEENRLLLYAQDIVPLNDFVDTISHHREILLRLRDNDGRIVSPSAFIGAAERYNYMPTIDRWVIRTLFNHIDNELNSDHPKNHAVESYTVNLSGSSLNDPEFVNFIHEQFDTHSVAPRRICFEITETAAISNLSRAVHFMHSLKARGCQFALDDFGNGLSSFAYLKNLPVDYLKIDGSFVSDIADDPIDSVMVSAINQIGHTMGIKTIAEFVENEAILTELKHIGVDYGQGYYINMPYQLFCPLSSSANKIA